MNRSITIHFLSNWLLSSGLGDGSLADAVLIRDTNGIPYIPGRTLKGLLCEAARELALARPELSSLHKNIFGTASESGQKKEIGQQGLIRVGRAELDPEIRDLLLSCEPAQRTIFVSDMTAIRYQTAIDRETNSSQPHSLRSLECGIAGLSFYADIILDIKVDTGWADTWLRAVCSLVRAMGTGRNRGLGRCHIHSPEWNGKLTLPMLPTQEEI
jgi:CRISPR/Cas system CSM-associated protein Csm3 (group 7 of RAMP superfamily)